MRFGACFGNTRCRFFALALLAGAAGCEKAQKAPPPPPPEVEVMTVATTNVPVYQEWIGSLDGFVNAQIRAQVSGYLMSQGYKEGGVVTNGQVLFEIDPRVFAAALAQANAQLGVAKAQLDKANLDVERYTPLVKVDAISKEELEDAVQAKAGAQANVEAANAAVQQARLNLDFASVRSPVNGIAGMALAQVGDLVGPGSSNLTTVSALDPIKAYITVSEQYYLDHLAGHLDQQGGSDLELDLILANDAVYPQKGKFYFVDRQVEPGTGAIQVAVTFPNPDNVLRPGQYARIRARTEVRQGVVLIPQRAVTELQGSYQVDVVKEVNGTNMVEIRPVQVGAQFGKLWVIEAGLKPGERIIVEGLQKVRQDSAVTVAGKG
ncbi:MAG: efflux RND transporter periplasmic adaptor subunit [Verrucomicrobiota bacterium]